MFTVYCRQCGSKMRQSRKNPNLWCCFNHEPPIFWNPKEAPKPEQSKETPKPEQSKENKFREVFFNPIMAKLQEILDRIENLEKKREIGKPFPGKEEFF